MLSNLVVCSSRCFFLHRPRLELFERISYRVEEMVRGICESLAALPPLPQPFCTRVYLWQQLPVPGCLVQYKPDGMPFNIALMPELLCRRGGAPVVHD